MLQFIVREHERLSVISTREPGQRALLQSEVDALMSLCTRQEIRPFDLGFRSIKFNQFCGVIQAKGVSIEVLPKIAGNDAFDRRILLRMLALAMNFPISRLDSQKLKLQSHSFLPVLAQWYCDELFDQFHRGLLRSYVPQEENLSVIRGRWRPDVDVRRFPGRKDRLNCEFDELTADNSYNRILKAALRKARSLSLGNSRSNKDLEFLANWFSDIGVNDVQASAADIRRLPKNRLVNRYSRALMMAEWFLDYSAPDIRTGKGDALSLLFDMNALFQAFLARVLRMVLPTDYHLREEGPRYFLARDQGGSNRFQMKPDICILKDNKVVAIIDAKWKRLSPDSLDGKLGVSQADMYQLFAYAKAYHCNRVALWYPGHEGLPSSRLRPSFDFLGEGKNIMEECLHIDWLALDPTCDRDWLRCVCDAARSGLSLLLRAEPIESLQAN